MVYGNIIWYKHPCFKGKFSTILDRRFLHGRKETDDRARYGAAGAAERGRTPGAVLNALPDAENLKEKSPPVRFSAAGGDFLRLEYIYQFHPLFPYELITCHAVKKVNDFLLWGRLGKS